jgi:transcriptional regulator with XRE-family HTH domain
MDYDDFRHRLGKRITALRLEKNIKQELLAELIEKSKDFVSLLERDYVRHPLKHFLISPMR